MNLRPTKEMLVAALALLVTALTIRGRMATPVSAGPLPKVPPVEAAAEVSKDEIPVAKPRLIAAARASDGRDPFAASDIWEDPTPVALPLPPELPDERILPVISLASGGARARAPHPPRIAALPKPVKEEPAAASMTAVPAEERKP
jgi:hypothetical protein